MPLLLLLEVLHRVMLRYTLTMHMLDSPRKEQNGQQKRLRVACARRSPQAEACEPHQAKQAKGKVILPRFI